MGAVNLQREKFGYWNRHYDEKLTDAFKKKHREEIEKMLAEWLKTNVIKRPKIEWRAYNYGNRKRKEL